MNPELVSAQPRFTTAAERSMASTRLSVTLHPKDLGVLRITLLQRYALHFLVQSGISYCIMIIAGVESMHQ
ncbi:hypothetical protein U0070_011400 [Myodes glareolus]|uniref:Uncharacterized protein n=1 Tax=Myodes glareolus TaxID=447135 RepID=A0AAW0HYB1_MYOGA